MRPNMKKILYQYGSGEKGAALLIVTILFAAASMTILLGLVAPVVRRTQMVRDFDSSKQSYFAAEAMSEDVFYRLKNNISISFPLSATFDGADVTVSSVSLSPTEEELTAQGVHRNNYRTVVKNLTVTDGFSFRYGIQAGLGGLYLFNNARVNGNVYSNGIVLGGNHNENSYNFIDGSAVSAGATGSIRYVNASSSAYAHNLRDSIIGGGAYYQVIDDVEVKGQLHPNSPDQPPIDFPITDEEIASWEGVAAAGGSVACTEGNYAINTSVTLGPKKIPCNLSITGNNTVLTLTGTLWVTGNITLSGSGGAGVQVKVADSIGNKSVVVIADNLSNKNGSGLISIANNTYFYGSTGNADSYVMLISGNTSAENGGFNVAIDVVNGSAGNLLIYASHGEIRLQNNVNLREVTAYKLSLYNNSVVNYLIGLAQPLFTSGPGGTWKIKHWKEI